MRGIWASLCDRLRFAVDADYRAQCIAEEVERQLQAKAQAAVREEMDRIGQRVAATISASFSD